MDKQTGNSDQARVIYCMMFDDRVSKHLCDLRRRELGDRGGFSCEGCNEFTYSSPRSNS